MRDHRTPGTCLPALIVLAATAVAAVFAPLLDCPPTRRSFVIPLAQVDSETRLAQLQALLQGRPIGRPLEVDCEDCGGRGRLSLFRRCFPRSY